MPRILAMVNAKGGDGKTTTVAHVAAVLAERGHRVLVIDLDPQGSLTLTASRFLDGGTEGLGRSVEHVLIYHAGTAGERPVSLAEVAVPSTLHESIRVVPALPSLLTTFGRIANEPYAREALLNALNELPADFADFALLDVGPSRNHGQWMSLRAAEGLVIPVQGGNFSFHGVTQVITDAKQFRRLNPSLSILGILPVAATVRTTQYRKFTEDTDAAWPGYLLPAVPYRTSVRDALDRRQTVIQAAPRSDVAEAWRAAVTEILARMESPA